MAPSIFITVLFGLHGYICSHEDNEKDKWLDLFYVVVIDHTFRQRDVMK